METPFFIPPESTWQQIIAQKTGIPFLLPYQELVIFHLLSALGLLPGSEDRYQNVLCLFPTGMGKSVCFMGPLGTLKGYGIVIYPLNALLSDQERRFAQAGIPCFVLKGGQTPAERDRGRTYLLEQGRGVLLTNPETLESTGAQKFWDTLELEILVVDEVHLVASWGDSFRPHFRSIGEFRRKRRIPVLAAFSATVPDCQLPILFESLFLQEPPLIIRAPMDRPNLNFSVIPSAYPEIFAPWLFTPWSRIFGIETLEQPAIIFSPTRSLAENTAFMLKRFFRSGDRGVAPEDVLFYHAGLDSATRRHIEKEFFKKTKGVMLATCAYGLGIDKPNIRSVLHLIPPENPESYIQESGRGGRDGAKARAILFVNPEGQKPTWAHEYSVFGQCRKQWLVRSLGEELEGCTGCDSCEERAHRIRLEDQIILHGLKLFGSRKMKKSFSQIIEDFRPSRKPEDIFWCVLTRGVSNKVLERWKNSALERRLF